jgi:hypothetical protein
MSKSKTSIQQRKQLTEWINNLWKGEDICKPYIYEEGFVSKIYKKLK